MATQCLYCSFSSVPCSISFQSQLASLSATSLFCLFFRPELPHFFLSSFVESSRHRLRIFLYFVPAFWYWIHHCKIVVFSRVDFGDGCIFKLHADNPAVSHRTFPIAIRNGSIIVTIFSALTWNTLSIFSNGRILEFRWRKGNHRGIRKWILAVNDGQVRIGIPGDHPSEPCR